MSLGIFFDGSLRGNAWALLTMRSIGYIPNLASFLFLISTNIQVNAPIQLVTSLVGCEHRIGCNQIISRV